MNIFWIIPLVIIALSGMLLLLLRGKPQGLKANAYQSSILGMSASALISLAKMQMPQFEIVVMTWCAAIIIAISVDHEIRRYPA